MSRSRYYVLLSLILVIAIFGLAYPLYVIRPFRYQGATELQAALFVLRYRGWVEILAAIASVVTVNLWWHTRKGKIIGVATTILVIGCGALTRVNVFEIMFHPNEKPSFASISEVKLDGDEKLIAVRLGDAARAYPVRNLAYHHLVNDTLGNVPIIATY